MVTYKLIDTLNTDSNSYKVCNLKSLFHTESKHLFEEYISKTLYPVFPIKTSIFCEVCCKWNYQE